MILLDNYDQRVGDDLKASICRGAKLRVAAASFSLHAFAELKKELGDIESFEFLWTVPKTDKGREAFAPLFGGEAEVGFRNRLTQQALARECKEWVTKKACFRLATEKAGALQSFASLDSNAGSVVYQPLTGFTADGLGYKLGSRAPVLTFRFDEPSIADSFQKLSDQVWNDPERALNVTDRICQLLDIAARDQSPERLYLQMLQSVFREFLDGVNGDALPNERSGFRDTLIWKKLFNFQSDAALGIIDKLERYDGCILADSVGLGKTFTALAVIKYYELRNKSVLVLCPKKLSDNWLNYNRNHKTNLFAADRFRYDVLCHTDLSRTSGESLGISLGKVNWGNYDLVVIDESHNFRNNEAVKGRETRYQKLLNKVIRDGVKTRVLMLSATPVNNHFKDLRNQIALAYEGQSESLSDKLGVGSSIEEIFRKAQAAFQKWAKSPPEQRTTAAILDALDLDFFQVLDAVTIARSRRQIQSSYDTSSIGKFPERLKPLSLRCPITTRADALGLKEIHARLSLLTLSIYAPLSFVLPSRVDKYEKQFDTEVAGRGCLRQTDRERSLQQLMTVNLLKRLESSIESFRLTLATLRQNLTKILETIAAFQQSVGNAVGRIEGGASKVGELDDEEQEDWDSIRTGGKVQVELADMDLLTWRQDLENDLHLIQELLDSMDRVTKNDDAKLQNLRQLILDKVARPLNTDNRKVLVFTAFADTANYLYEALAPELSKLGLHTAKVTGSAPPRSTLGKNHDFQSVLTLFSPRSKEKAQSLPDEVGEIDILIATDCISEGQNLQDCDFLVNYDIHWNPVRIIQRFGRIDRIGSVNEVIQLVNYWPDISLDDYIHLKERVENRMVLADAVATADDNVLAPEAEEVAYRKEQLRRLQEDVVELEDLKTGVNITDLGLNDFRMDLLQARRDGRNLSYLPSGLFAVLPSDEQRGLVAGALFALRQIDGKATDPHNRLHPYALVYVDAQGAIVSDHTQAKVQLDRWRMACRSRTEPDLAVCELFKQSTNDGKDMSQMVRLLEAAVRSMSQVNEEKDLDSFFTRSRTTASRKHMRNLDDYEVIGFLPVVDMP